MKRFTSKTQKIGELGEDIAVKFLMKHGYEIVERNYTIKAGEIDIITLKNNQLCFWEVKTAQRFMRNNVPRETYNPFENMSPNKMKRFSRTVEYYLYANKVSHETVWAIHGLAVYLNLDDKKAKVEIMENII